MNRTIYKLNKSIYIHLYYLFILKFLFSLYFCRYIKFSKEVTKAHYSFVLSILCKYIYFFHHKKFNYEE